MLFFIQIWNGIKLSWSDYKKAIFGVILVILPFIDLYLLGFLLACFQSVRKGVALPSFFEWKRLLKLSVYGVIIVMAYLLGIFVSSAFIVILGSFSAEYLLLLLFTMLLLLIDVVFILYILYSLPAALARVANSESLVEGFRFADIFVAVTDWQYARALLQQFVILACVVFVLFILSRVGFGSFMLLYFLMVGIVIWTAAMSGVYVIAGIYGVSKKNKNNSRTQ